MMQETLTEKETLIEGDETEEGETEEGETEEGEIATRADGMMTVPLAFTLPDGSTSFGWATVAEGISGEALGALSRMMAAAAAQGFEVVEATASREKARGGHDDDEDTHRPPARRLARGLD